MTTPTLDTNFSFLVKDYDGTIRTQSVAFYTGGFTDQSGTQMSSINRIRARASGGSDVYVENYTSSAYTQYMEVLGWDTTSTVSYYLSGAVIDSTMTVGSTQTLNVVITESSTGAISYATVNIAFLGVEVLTINSSVVVNACKVSWTMDPQTYDTSRSGTLSAVYWWASGYGLEPVKETAVITYTDGKSPSTQTYTQILSPVVPQ